MELPSTGATGEPIAVDRDAEAAFSVDESHNPLRIELEPRLRGFLLIVRTGRIVTAHAATLLKGCDINEYRRIHGGSSI